MTRISAVAACTPGYFCVSGVKAACAPGTYGSTFLLNTSACSGVCPAGFVCGPATSNYSASPCGAAVFYCPLGSSVALPVASGYYAVGPSRMAYDAQPCDAGHYCTAGVRFPCAAGRYGCSTHLSTPDCNGLCLEGFYCDLGSTSNHEAACGATFVFCPLGAAAPTAVSVGWYTVGGPDFARAGQLPCPAGVGAQPAACCSAR